MKSYIKFLTAVGTGCLLFASCDNDEFLETTKYDILEPSVQFANDDYALMNLNGIYTFNGISDFDGSWGYKPNMFTGTHPTMDTQCTGWDVKFLDQTWDASVGELGEGWAHAYAAIQNILTISPYHKYGDPEVGQGDVLYTGLDTGRYPTPRTYMCGLSVTF